MAVLPDRRLKPLLLAPAVWGAHFAGAYALLSVGCALRWQAHEWLGVDLIRWLLAALTLAAAGALGALMVQAWRASAGAAAADEAARAARFHARVISGLALLSLVAVLWLGSAIAMMRPCI